MAQSYGRCGGREVALDLLKTPLKSWYSAGTPTRSGDEVEQDGGLGAKACFGQT